MKIENHMIEGVDFIESPNHGGEIEPDTIVMHYTAGYSKESAIHALTDVRNEARRRVSAHVVIDRDGSITQLVPFNIKAWHAGPSRYRNRRGLNNFSIGIELVGIGWYRERVSDGKYGNWFGGVKSREEIVRTEGRVVEAANSRIGTGVFLWPEYTRAQLDSCEDLVRKLIDMHKIRDIVSHEDIDLRKWRTDPGPAFPMERFRDMIPIRRTRKVIASVLNVRKGPGMQYPVVGTLRKGETINVYTTLGNWVSIDQDHWMHADYLT